MSSDDRATTEDGCSEMNWLQMANETSKRKLLFEQELTTLINKFSIENGSGTPDYVIAHYLMGCLNTFESTVGFRERWYGRPQDQFGMPVKP